MRVISQRSFAVVRPKGRDVQVPANAPQESFRIAQFMLPHSQDRPAIVPQAPCDAPVAHTVPYDFRGPESSVGCWPLVTSGTPVPEASIDKNGRPQLLEDKVWCAHQTLMPAPPADSRASEQSGQREFRCLVSSRLDPPHTFRSFVTGQEVWHVAQCSNHTVSQSTRACRRLRYAAGIPPAEFEPIRSMVAALSFGAPQDQAKGVSE